MIDFSELLILAEAAKKKKKKKQVAFTPYVIDPVINPGSVAGEYVNEQKLINEVAQVLIEKSTDQFPKSGKVNIDAVQKSMAYNMAALAAAAALMATKVLVDPKFANNNRGLSARFNDALQRAMNVVASDGSILQRLKYNTNLSTFVTNEHKIPDKILSKIVEKFGVVNE